MWPFYFDSLKIVLDFLQVTFQLSETDTIWHFDMPGVSVSRDSELAEQVTMRNERYEEVCSKCCLLSSYKGRDNYISRGE